MVGCLPINLPTISGRNCTHFCKDTLVPMRGKRKSVAVSSRQFTGFCAPAPSGVNCQPTLASGTVSSSATHAGKRTVFGLIYSNSSLRTQTWQRSCPTAPLYAPICAQQAVQKWGRSLFVHRRASLNNVRCQGLGYVDAGPCWEIPLPAWLRVRRAVLRGLKAQPQPQGVDDLQQRCEGGIAAFRQRRIEVAAV